MEWSDDDKVDGTGNFPEISGNFPEISGNFPEISGKRE